MLILPPRLAVLSLICPQPWLASSFPPIQQHTGNSANSFRQYLHQVYFLQYGEQVKQKGRQKWGLGLCSTLLELPRPPAPSAPGRNSLPSASVEIRLAARLLPPLQLSSRLGILSGPQRDLDWGSPSPSLTRG